MGLDRDGSRRSDETAPGKVSPSAPVRAIPNEGPAAARLRPRRLVRAARKRQNFQLEREGQGWKPADFQLPPGCSVLDQNGRDNGLRFADLNGDGFDDIIQSNGDGYAIYLWAGVVKNGLGWTRGWPHLVAQGPAATDLAKARVLPFVIDGHSNGAWFHGQSIVWQNENIPPLAGLGDAHVSGADRVRRAAAAHAGAIARRAAAGGGVHGRAGRERAADREPVLFRLGRRGPALGRRDARLSARHGWPWETGRRDQDADRQQRRRALRQGDRFPRGHPLPQQPDAVAQRRCSSPPRRTSSSPPIPMATAARTSAASSSPASRKATSSIG